MLSSRRPPSPGPVYLRLGRYPAPVIFGPEHVFRPGAARLLREGADVVIFACGIMTARALETAAPARRARRASSGDECGHAQASVRGGGSAGRLRQEDWR